MKKLISLFLLFISSCAISAVAPICLNESTQAAKEFIVEEFSDIYEMTTDDMRVTHVEYELSSKNEVTYFLTIKSIAEDSEVEIQATGDYEDCAIQSVTKY